MPRIAGRRYFGHAYGGGPRQNARVKTPGMVAQINHQGKEHIMPLSRPANSPVQYNGNVAADGAPLAFTTFPPRRLPQGRPLPGGAPALSMPPSPPPVDLSNAATYQGKAPTSGRR